MKVRNTYVFFICIFSACLFLLYNFALKYITHLQGINNQQAMQKSQSQKKENSN